MFQELKKIYANAKEAYSRPRYIYTMFVMPIFYAVSTVLLLADLFMLLIAREKLLIPCMVIFGAILLAIIVLTCFRPYVFKADVKKEADRLRGFFASNLIKNPKTEYELPRSDQKANIPLSFSQEGIEIGDMRYTYKAFECALFTSNFNHRVNLIMLFNRTEAGDKEDGDRKGVAHFSLPVDINLLSVMNKYDIKIANGDVFAFIRDNCEEASRQILKYGRIQTDYDRYRTR